MPRYGGGRRRVPGLRREEVALLAGVSVGYYTRLKLARSIYAPLLGDERGEQEGWIPASR